MPWLPLAPPALLHVGASISLTSFTVHWSTVIGLAVMAGLYEWRAAAAKADMGYGIRDMGAESISPTQIPYPISRFRRCCFYGALATIFLSLNGWLHDLSDWYLFSAHMVQHLLLTL
ncbi:MAG: cytochrome c oxidase assembly protein, partial [Gemmatimonadaceae bacterium]